MVIRKSCAAKVAFKQRSKESRSKAFGLEEEYSRRRGGQAEGLELDRSRLARDRCV